MKISKYIMSLMLLGLFATLTVRAMEEEGPVDELSSKVDQINIQDDESSAVSFDLPKLTQDDLKNKENNSLLREMFLASMKKEPLVDVVRSETSDIKKKITLINALKLKRYDLVQALLEGKTDPNFFYWAEKEDMYHTPLFGLFSTIFVSLLPSVENIEEDSSVENFQEDFQEIFFPLVTLLLKHNADVNIKHHNKELSGATVLHLAAMMGNVTLAQALVEKGAQVNALLDENAVIKKIDSFIDRDLPVGLYTPLSCLVALLPHFKKLFMFKDIVEAGRFNSKKSRTCEELRRTYLSRFNRAINQIEQNQSLFSDGSELESMKKCRAIFSNINYPAVLNYLTLRGGKLAIEHCENLILKKDSRLYRFLKNVTSFTELEALRLYAVQVKNKQAVRYLKSRLEKFEESLQLQLPNTNNKKKSKKQKQRRGKKIRRQQVVNKSAYQEEDECELNDLDTSEMAEQFTFVDVESTKVTITSGETISNFQETEKNYVFVYPDLAQFGGEELTITIPKQKINENLKELGQFGFNLSRRVLIGTRKKKEKHKKSCKVKLANGWSVDRETLVNPKMNNPEDPLHAFPLFIDRNFTKFAVFVQKENFDRLDYRDVAIAGKRLSKNPNKSDYAYKLYFEVPCNIKTDTKNITGLIEYVILVPTGEISSQNRPLCVHRFLRPYQQS